MPKMDKIAQYKFFDFPLKYEFKDYQEAMDNYVGRISRIPDVKGIYRVGNISVSGISDIDLVVVLNDELKHSTYKNYSINGLDEKAKYLFMHNPLILNEKTFRALNLFSVSDYLEEIKPCNQEINFKKLSLQEESSRKIADLVDFNGDLTWNYTYTLVSGQCPVRQTIAQLSKLRKNIEYFKGVTGQSKSSWDEYIKEIADLRKNWFLSETKEKKTIIVGLLKKALGAIYELNFCLEEYLEEQSYIKRMRMPNFLLVQHNYQRFTIFYNNSNGCMLDKYYEVTHSLYKKNRQWHKWFLVFLPLSFCSQWMFYRNADGEFSNAFKRYLPEIREIQDAVENDTYRDILLKRTELLNEQANFLKKNRFSYGLLIQPLIKPSFYGTKKGQISAILKYPLKELLRIRNRYALFRAISYAKS